MSPIIVTNRSKLPLCSVSGVGIGLKQPVIEQAGWTIGDLIEVGFIPKARCILLRSVPEHGDFRLAYANKQKKTGGRIYCQAFVRNYVQTLVRLPKKHILPLFPKGTEWTIALLLEPIDWATQEFSKAGCDNIPKDAIGVYELLGSGDAVLRIGEGKLRDRINAHLKDSRFSTPTVKLLRYLTLNDPTDAKIVEKIQIEAYKSESGVLPLLQEIRA